MGERFQIMCARTAALTATRWCALTRTMRSVFAINTALIWGIAALAGTMWTCATMKMHALEGIVMTALGPLLLAVLADPAASALSSVLADPTVVKCYWESKDILFVLFNL